jgi:hypothetical protein
MRKFLTLEASTFNELATKLNKEIEKYTLINPKVEGFHQSESHHFIQMMYSFDTKNKTI